MPSVRNVRTGRAVWLPLLVVAAAVGLFLIAARVLASDGPSSWSRGGALALLDAVEREARFPSPVRGATAQSGPDGPMPEIAARSLMIAAPQTDVLDKLSRACVATGLTLADQQLKAAEPDLLCRGRWRDRQVSVHADLRCAARCDLALETRVLPF